MPGTHHDAWKLTRQQKAAILRRYRSGEKVTEIAADYDIATQVVCYHAQMRSLRRRRTALKWTRDKSRSADSAEL